MKLFEELIRHDGEHEMVLDVKHENKAALKLYEKFNFKVVRSMKEGMVLVRAPDAHSNVPPSKHAAAATANDEEMVPNDTDDDADSDLEVDWDAFPSASSAQAEKPCDYDREEVSGYWCSSVCAS